MPGLPPCPSGPAPGPVPCPAHKAVTKATATELFGAESRKGFWAAESDNRNGQSPSLRASKKRAEARLPQAALGTSPNFLVPGEGGVGRRKIWASGMASSSELKQGGARAPVGPGRGTYSSCLRRLALHLQEAHLPAPASLSFPPRVATKLKNQHRRACWPVGSPGQ